MENKYKDTLNLPLTDMPMRAGLTQKEPQILEIWEKENIYQKRQSKNTKNPSFILHDGPPYPNGDIHLGHALNKILKDIINKYHLLNGKNTPYVPGWDCHGLPIETQLLKDLKKEKQESKINDRPWFREKCKEYALKYVDNQKNQFKKLGVFGDFANPYLTLNPEYEAKVIELFGNLAEKGLVYKGRKPIHWCSSCVTALAEAEIEYDNKKSPSIYFKCVVENPTKKSFLPENSAFIVWTTTPWTLPANVAIAVNPTLQYEVVQTSDKQVLILCSDLTETVMQKINQPNYKILHTVSGTELEGLQYQHPFYKRVSPVVTADYVSHEDGSGIVHIAPGHGQEDYIVGMKNNLDTLMPVDDNGVLTDEAGEFKGLHVWDANKAICQKMEDLKTLLRLEFIEHSYPHCWRCHNPVIFRATEQWFIAMDDKNHLRQSTLKAIKNVRWVPNIGEKRITSMIEQRPDWCISRQRSWGIPIPVFYCEKCREPHLTGIFNKAVIEAVAKEGTNIWFTKSAKEILPKGTKCTNCGHDEFSKETDIMDVWLESGASHNAVLNQTPALSYPADLYVEGSDQHRGWFQSSILTAVGQNNSSPFKSVLTHGFVVDGNGKKMSKSKGNVIDPLKIVAQNGADILRLWVCSSDFQNDIAVSENIIKQNSDSFLKIRNTIRFLLSNLYDFDSTKNHIEYSKLNEIDQWILIRLQNLIEKAHKSFDEFEFHSIYHSIINFCTVDLSAIYLDIHKDSLYCNKADSAERRSTQNAFYEIAKNLIVILAPFIPFTAEDTYSYLPGKKFASVFLEDYPQVNKTYANPKLEAKFEKLLAVRDAINIELEELRRNKVIGSSLDAQVTIETPEPFTQEDINSIIIISQITIKKGPELKVTAAKAEGEKCERCWKYAKLAGDLCPRCKEVVG